MRVIRRRIIISFYELYDVVPYSSYTTGNAGPASGHLDQMGGYRGMEGGLERDARREDVWRGFWVGDVRDWG